jgi:uncharacterized protein YqeY
MSIASRLQSDLATAMRGGNQLQKDTIRLLRSNLKNAQIDKGKELDESEVVTVLQKAAKQRRDAISQYNQAGRSDLAAKEEAELEIITSYLPQQLSSAEIKKELQVLIAETGASSSADLGKIMGQAMARLKGKVDGNQVNQLARELLAE